ncbi:hypothetical protein OAS48_04205 [Gammaproteobacteria bacterium]|jgi:hypothetical protein|nr:hypothetical protein [Gammaproteobacteria bacterium]|tara:strand:- start:182 stop:706 length:525 start_codon:yes stop_codon:yes gene_type:complete
MTIVMFRYLHKSRNFIIIFYTLLLLISCATPIEKEIADNHCQVDWSEEVFTCTKKSSGRVFYVGEMIIINNDSLKHGKGKEFYEDGSSYIGDFAYGIRDGVGKYVFPENATCYSKWKEDKQTGEVTCFYLGSERGHQRKGMTDGSGNWMGKTLYTYPSGVSITENWENGSVVKD